MRKTIICTSLCLFLSKGIVARSCNEMLEIAIDNYDDNAVTLILAQTSLTQKEKQIFLERAQAVIDDLKHKLDLSEDINLMRGAKRLAGGFIVVAMGGFMWGKGAGENNGTLVKVGLATALGGSVLTVLTACRLSDEEEDKLHSAEHLRKAMEVKAQLLRARTKN